MKTFPLRLICFVLIAKRTTSESSAKKETKKDKAPKQEKAKKKEEVKDLPDDEEDEPSLEPKTKDPFEAYPKGLALY